jgi:hypothetical protein
MHPSERVPGDGMMPAPGEAHVRSARGPRPLAKSYPAGVPLLLARDDGQFAARMNDVVVRRLFSAGLFLQSALGRMGGDHPVAGKIRDAIDELDLAIQDIRIALFDDVTGTGGPPPPPMTGRPRPPGTHE